MPVARSDPRRATLIGVAGIVVGAVLIAVVLLANEGGERVGGVRSGEFDVGPAESRAGAIERDGTPLLFQDPARFSRPIWVQHLGDDPEEGWLAFDAAVGGCATAWEREARVFRDCEGRTYPEDGSGLPQLPVTVEDDHVVVDLSPDDDEPSTSITITGNR